METSGLVLFTENETLAMFELKNNALQSVCKVENMVNSAFSPFQVLKELYKEPLTLIHTPLYTNTGVK